MFIRNHTTRTPFLCASRDLHQAHWTGWTCKAFTPNGLVCQRTLFVSLTKEQSGRMLARIARIV